jgi:hypothetical protein
MDTGSAFAAVNWLAVLVAAVSTFVLGGLWYGPLFGKTWLAVTGIPEERLREGNQGVIFGVSFVLELIAAVLLAMFLGPESTLAFGIFAGLSVGLGWVGTSLGVTYLFERRPLGHWGVNAGYQTVAFLIMGAILGAWH